MSAKWRVGHGIDVHAFDDAAGTDEALVLGGVRIQGAGPLVGHSDGDVVLHALVDALLGGVAAGDLGSRFGTEDPAYAGADSALFVAEAMQVIASAGYEVANADLTVVAARPRVAPHRAAMRSRIAELIGVDEAAVSVKATTTDGLGFAGRGEGVTAFATVMLRTT